MAWSKSARADVGRPVLAASLLLPLAGISLHVLGLRRTLRLFAGKRTACSGPPAREVAERVAHAVERAGRAYSIYPADCLVRSLVLVRLLHRRGLEARLRFGARTLTGEFEAHAWVEHCGVPLGVDGSAARIFYAFESPAGTPHAR